jgi:hypothetical protein
VVVKHRRLIMPRNPENWFELVFACERKLKIAEYHHERLMAELSSSDLAGDELPPIPVQAHLEGALTAIASAEDQLAKAVLMASGMKHDGNNYRDRGMQIISDLMPEVQGWRKKEIGKDIRSMRNRIVHCH